MRRTGPKFNKHNSEPRKSTAKVLPVNLILRIKKSDIQYLFQYAQQLKTFNDKDVALGSFSKRNIPTLTAKAKHLKSYLNLLVHENLVSKNIADSAWELWQGLDDHFLGELPVPTASPGPDGQILYTWDQGEHHLEIEFVVNEPATMFYMNRTTEFCEEYRLGNILGVKDEGFKWFRVFIVKFRAEAPLPVHPEAALFSDRSFNGSLSLAVIQEPGIWCA